MTNLWVTIDELGDEWSDSEYAYDAVKTASFLMWALSGRKFNGLTTVTERYTNTCDPYGRGGAGQRYTPVLVNGQVQNIGGGGYGDVALMGDGTSAPTSLRLRGTKIIKVHAVRVMSGYIVPPTQYYLGDHSTLYAAAGASWTNDAVEVSYTYGSQPPTAGKAAARALATELVKSFEGCDDCRLPDRVTSVTRQGVSYTILDDQNFLDELKTGIYTVDLFLRSVNPDKARARAKVFSADTPRARRITGQSPRYALSAQDIYINTDGGSLLLYLDDINAEFVNEDNTFVVTATLTSLDGSRTTTTATAPTFVGTFNVPGGYYVIEIPYNEMLAISGPRDPAVLDVYATRPITPVPPSEATEEVNLISSSNAIIRLGSPVIPVYSA